MTIKDKGYWKEYNAKRKAYIQQKNQERYLKGSINTTKDTTENNTTLQINTTDTTIPQVVLKKDTTKNNTTTDTTEEQIQPINTTQEKIIQPTPQSLQPPKCPRCPEIETSITNLANLYQQEQKKNKEQKKANYQLQKQTKELELKIISLQETNQILRKDLGYWQAQPSNPSPYEQVWKEKYLELEKKTDEKLKEQTETINRLKEKFLQKDKENQAWEQKYRRLENISKNNTNSLSIPHLNHLITKHTQIQNSQHRYTEKDVQEREFLKSLLDKLWTFN